MPPLPRAPRPPARPPAARPLPPRAAAGAAGAKKAPPAPAITLTPAAAEQCRALRAAKGSDDFVLRVGVKSGGCNGMRWGVGGGRARAAAASNPIPSFRPAPPSLPPV
jgi:hypothetical protein